MPGYHTLRASARKIADASTNAEVKAVLELFIKLVDECEKTDRQIQAANRSTQSRPR